MADNPIRIRISLRTPETSLENPVVGPFFPSGDPAEPSERPRGALSETPAEPSERPISSESLAEGCAPRMVTLRNFKRIAADSNRCDFKLRVSDSSHLSQSTTLFGDHPFSIKHPQDNFSLQNVNWHPPKCKLTPSKKGLATSNLQFLYRNTQKSPLANLYFGGRQFAFWRLKLSWGCFIERGDPQKRWYFSFSAIACSNKGGRSELPLTSPLCSGGNFPDFSNGIFLIRGGTTILEKIPICPIRHSRPKLLQHHTTYIPVIVRDTIQTLHSARRNWENTTKRLQTPQIFQGIIL